MSNKLLLWCSLLFFFFFNIYLFIYFIFAASGLSCGLWDPPLRHVGFSLVVARVLSSFGVRA